MLEIPSGYCLDGDVLSTPPDFGALVIQRRRWANGSLLILPKLFRYLWKNRGDRRILPEAILRTQYLASTALGTLVAIVLPFLASDSVLAHAHEALALTVIFASIVCVTGFSGHITLELSNVANLPITLWPGMKIGQLCLFRLTTPAEHSYGSAIYGSRYQDQRGPTPSRSFRNFTRAETRRPAERG